MARIDPNNPPKFYFIQVQDAGVDLDQETSYLDFKAGFDVDLDAANDRARITVSYTTLGFTTPVGNSGKVLRSDNTNWVASTFTTADTFAQGDIPHASAANTVTALAIGTAGRWLGSSGTLPEWNAPAALTGADDTNVTLTLGGSATTALLNAASLTLGWTGQLAVGRGGTGLSSLTLNQIPYGNGTSAFQSSANLVFNGSQMGIGGALSTSNGLKVTSTIANTANAAILNLQGGATASSGTVSIAYGALAQPTFTMTGQAITQAYGMFFEAFSTPNMATGATTASAAIGSLRTRLNLTGTSLTGTILQGIGVLADQPRNDGTTSSVTFTAVSGIQVNRQDAFVNAGVTVTSARGVAIADNTSATNNVNLLIGTTTSPSGTYSIRNASAAVNTHTGNSFFGGTTTPTAKAHLGAGTATASTAPLKFTSGTSLTSAEAGAMEFTTDDLFFTITTGPTRKTVALADSTLTSGSLIEATTNGRLQNATTTGTGNAVRATSPTLVTPALGTPSSATLTNATGLPISTGVSGLGSGMTTLLAQEFVGWTTPTFNSGDFTGSSSMTWTVAEADVATFKYMILGKMMCVMASLQNTTVGGTPAADLQITIPASKTATSTVYTAAGYINDNGTELDTGTCRVEAGGTLIKIRKNAAGSAWSAATDTTYVIFQMFFQID